MTCNPTPLTEIPGSYNACQILIVRECLSVNGVDVIPGPASVITDGITTQGAGTLASPIAIKAVQHDGSIVGAGTVASPLSVAGGGSTHTDGVTITGDGSIATPIKILAVQHDAFTLTGAGTVALPLTAVQLQGASGRFSSVDNVAGVPLCTITTVDHGNVAIQAQSSDGTNGVASLQGNNGVNVIAGGVTLGFQQAYGAGSVALDNVGHTTKLGINMTPTHPAPLYPLDVRAAGGVPNSLVGMVNLDNTGNSAVDFYDQAFGYQCSVGFANSLSVAFATIPAVRSHPYCYSAGAVGATPDWLFVNGSRIAMRVGMDETRAFIELAHGGAAAVGTANCARIRYNIATTKLEVSLNGAAYVTFVTI